MKVEVELPDSTMQRIARLAQERDDGKVTVIMDAVHLLGLAHDANRAGHALIAHTDGKLTTRRDDYTADPPTVPGIYAIRTDGYRTLGVVVWRDKMLDGELVYGWPGWQNTVANAPTGTLWRVPLCPVEDR